jgi:hypothetical protein
MSKTNDSMWRTSSFTDGVQCVEVAVVGDEIAVRDTKDRDGATLHFTRGEMRAFIQGVKAGEFDDLT